MKKIILCPHMDRDVGLEITEKAKTILTGAGHAVAVCPLYDDGGRKPEAGSGFTELADELEGADAIITLGGDGTMLRAARASAGSNVPMLGINLGSKGFLAELEKSDTEMLPSLMGGTYSVERRVMLDVELHRGSRVLYRDFSLNDIVVRGYSKIIETGVFGDGQRISHYNGDGVIIATPTGSTAYSMAAGGPIVEPTADNIIVTPVSAHVLAARSFVLAPERVVTVKLGVVKNNPAYMSVDGGKCIELDGGDEITVKRSEKATWFIHVAGRSFYQRVSEKLGDG